ncbi:MAG: hypothetical protein IJI46_08520 [Erysipelotrichaceae bacterium]|nr:hypothetical protein [Erysipelotrichaceae bacterium]
MQLKLYKRSTILLSIVVICELTGIILLLKYREKWLDHKIAVILAFALFLLLINGIFSYYDLNADKNLIRKAVSNGDVALAKIKDGSFVRFGRDARLKNHVFWKLDVEIYDNEMKKFDAQIIEKFSLHQTAIPKGYVYVTYVEGKLDECLIIPNMIISSIQEYKPLVEDYEKALKPKYLNAYINDGLILETYEDSLKKSKEA